MFDAYMDQYPLDGCGILCKHCDDYENYLEWDFVPPQNNSMFWAILKRKYHTK